MKNLYSQGLKHCHNDSEVIKTFTLISKTKHSTSSEKTLNLPRVLRENMVSQSVQTTLISKYLFKVINNGSRVCCRIRLKLQSFTIYLRQTVVSCEIAHYRKRSIFIFHEFFASTDKIFVSGGGLGTRQ